jgi:hypothetical protein
MSADHLNAAPRTSGAARGRSAREEAAASDHTPITIKCDAGLDFWCSSIQRWAVAHNVQLIVSPPYR